MPSECRPKIQPRRGPVKASTSELLHSCEPQRSESLGLISEHVQGDRARTSLEGGGSRATILLAESAGFCFGVERAIDLTYATVESVTGSRLATLGPLIHNPQVVSSLKERGIQAVEGVRDALEEGVDTLIFRSHGVTAESEEEARSAGLKTVDATCPYVLTSQRYAVSAAKRGEWLVIVGNPDHPEILGIFSRASKFTDRITILSGLSQIGSVPAGLDIAILAQTTYPPSLYREIVERLEEKAASLRVYQTICSATEERQRDSEKLAGQADCVIVVGGYNSSNTAKLAEICKKKQERTYSIEVASELKEGWIVGLEKIGVTAGASTPQSAIEEVIERIKIVIGNLVHIEVVSG